MTTEWVITSAAERVALNGGKGETPFTVTNPGAAQDRVVFDVVPGDGADAAWFPPPEERQALVPGGGSTTFLQKIVVPAGAPAGSYWFQGLAYSADSAPEEGSRRSGRVAFDVAPSLKPKRPWWPYAVAAGLVLVVLVVVGILVLRGGGHQTAQSTRSPSPAITPAPPVLLSPPNGSVFNIYPRTTQYRWSPVPGATSYQIQIEFCQGPCTDANSAQWATQTVTGTSYTNDFVGAQPGRWRVQAVFPAGATATSDWWQFSYLK